MTAYLGRHGESRAAKAALISAVPPLMLKTEANPKGLPKEVFDGLQAQLAANRSQFYYDLPAGPFYGFNRPGVKTIETAVWNWWRQGMMGGAKAHYDGIVAFSQTDFTEDLKKINVPVLVMHSEDDQIVPYVAAGPLSAKLLKNGTLKTYKDFPHGMITTQADVDQRRPAGVHQGLDIAGAGASVPALTLTAAVSPSAAATRARSFGRTSVSNQGLRRIQPVLRQLGCGNGRKPGGDRLKLRTVSVSVIALNARR